MKKKSNWDLGHENMLLIADVYYILGLLHRDSTLYRYMLNLKELKSQMNTV